MAKLSSKGIKASTGIGTFVEKTIKYRDKDGEEASGEILVRIPSQDEFSKFAEVFGENITVGQLSRALVFGTIYEEENKQFFSKIEETATEITPEVLNAMYAVADEVCDFSGKNWILTKMKNSGTNSSVAGSVEKPLRKPSAT